MPKIAKNGQSFAIFGSEVEAAAEKAEGFEDDIAEQLRIPCAGSAAAKGSGLSSSFPLPCFPFYAATTENDGFSWHRLLQAATNF